MKCRFCEKTLETCLVDLGSAPPSNAYLTPEAMKAPEKWFPLRVLVCDSCWLVQTEDFAAHDELFTSDYAYFSSFSKSWLEHSEAYQKTMTARFGLDASSHVVEVAANDGYLLQFFKAAGIPCLGVEPTASTAKAAREKGIETLESFFSEQVGRELAANGKAADLTAANNVLAHVPDINDFAKGFAAILKPNGVSTFEFPSFLNLVNENQFDTIYHEHFSYLSLTAVETVFTANGLTVFNVEDIPTHGGSLRVFAQRSDTGQYEKTDRLVATLKREADAGMSSLALYQGFQAKTDKVKDDFVRFLIELKAAGKIVAGYGAAAKGNTLMNYAGIRPDLISFVVDRNPAKQDKFLPGSRIPIVTEDIIKAEKPDYIVILPWNLRNEVMEQLSYIRDWGGQFVTAVPSLMVN